jgi:hypothetical protein
LAARFSRRQRGNDVEQQIEHKERQPCRDVAMAMDLVNSSDGTSKPANPALRATSAQPRVCFRKEWPQPQSINDRPRRRLIAMAAANTPNKKIPARAPKGPGCADNSRMPTSISTGGSRIATGATAQPGSRR